MRSDSDRLIDNPHAPWMMTEKGFSMLEQRVRRVRSGADFSPHGQERILESVAGVNLELPAELVSAAKLDQGNVSHEAAKLIALELFREGAVSIGRAAELCATPLAAFMDYAATRGVPPLNYDM